VTEVLVVLLSVPQAVPLQPVPDSDQVTPLLCVSFVTVAAKACAPIPACIFALVGETVTTIAPDAGVVADAVFEYGLRFPAASVARAR
jgi:hypothetical protein